MKTKIALCFEVGSISVKIVFCVCQRNFWKSQVLSYFTLEWVSRVLAKALCLIYIFVQVEHWREEIPRDEEGRGWGRYEGQGWYGQNGGWWRHGRPVWPLPEWQRRERQPGEIIDRKKWPQEPLNNGLYFNYVCVLFFLLFLEKMLLD